MTQRGNHKRWHTISHRTEGTKLLMNPNGAYVEEEDISARNKRRLDKRKKVKKDDEVENKTGKG